MITAAATAPPKPDYGLDFPAGVRSMFSRGAWTLAFAIAIYFINHSEYPGPAARLLAVLGAIGIGFLAAGYFMIWSSRTAKFKVRDEILDGLALRGDEKVLDVGCGKGLMLVGAAKRLKTGRVTGIDLTGEAEAARENARIEGVAEKIRVEPGKPEKLVYPDGNFDVVVSALALHQAAEPENSKKLVREMLRVLKPGGQIAIFDLRRTGDYARTLRESGAASVELSPVRFLWCRLARTVTARK